MALQETRISQRIADESKLLAAESKNIAEASKQIAEDSIRVTQQSTAIAADSNKLAIAAKKDSSAMLGIALLTMFFLPPSFVTVSYLLRVPIL
jgi:hypothetical protein